VVLTGADVFWLANQSRSSELAQVPDPNSDPYLALYQIERGEGDQMPDLHLEGAFLSQAHLEAAALPRARLQGASLDRAYLEGADLDDADLQGADLRDADLSRGNLYLAHLEGADLSRATLRWAYLFGTSFDKASTLKEAALTGVILDQATFDTTNLSVVDWREVPVLGDELSARKAKDTQDDGYRNLWRFDRRNEFLAAVRAYRRLAVALQTNGLSEDASRYLYRAQFCQRAALFYGGRIPQWLGSWVLAALAGYGFRPGRTLVWYLALIAAFAVSYYLLGPTQGHSFQPDGALVFSVTSFHGRGFFPESLSFESWVTRLAALEAVLGLLIEISFIATFTQRFFGAK